MGNTYRAFGMPWGDIIGGNQLSKHRNPFSFLFCLGYAKKTLSCSVPRGCQTAVLVMSGA
ncbi:hypothetical protein E2C01_000123 [Portunus trituberculatus]|uniref:Uncharacterized protein n=1 Tax=Portunus trituberculatus TaxID=210409 RepID=A0A5B7CDG6_PORTR|nr:hypothetical protein [Portunus trituberculatus]